MGDRTADSVPSKYAVAGKTLRLVSWLQILFPSVTVLVTIPEGSLVLLAFGGIILVAPPIALGVAGLGIARGLLTGNRRLVAALFALLQGGAYLFLALNSRTWEVPDGEEVFYSIVRLAFWIAASLNAIVLVALASPVRRPRATSHVSAAPLEMAPPLWPWIVGAVVILALIVLGIAVPGKG